MVLHPELERFIDVFKVQRYLEIGLGDETHFRNLTIPMKIGISPGVKGVSDNGCIIHGVESDIGFQLIQDKTFELIFVDGLHEYTQVMRDINNSLELLEDGGFIIVHDVNCIHDDKPDEVFDKIRSNPNYGWCGDVWKAVMHIGFYRSDLDYCVIVDQDWVGFMVIWKLPDGQHRTKTISSTTELYPCDSLTRNFAFVNTDMFNFVTLDYAIELCKNVRGM